MSDFTLSIQPIWGWFPAFGMIFITNLTVAFLNRPLGHYRWLFALFVALSPSTCPAMSQSSPNSWDALSLIVTTLTIVTAARLPDLDHVLRSQKRGRWALFLWMSLPMARLSPPPQKHLKPRLKRALIYLSRAGAKVLTWAFISYLMSQVPSKDLHWIIKSSTLIFYFVLNVTAIADLLMALCLALNTNVDELFDAPLLSSSPRDFWSRRWNKYINRFALKHVALKMRKGTPSGVIILTVFVTSGAFHEYFAWGASGGTAPHGWMMLFFLIQGVFIWVGTRLPLPPLPHSVGTFLTFLWMTATAPLFFIALAPALQAFGFPNHWLPFSAFS